MKKDFPISIVLVTLMGLTPVVASAFAFPNLSSFVSELLAVNKIILNILITLAFLAFFWGVAKFILAAGETKAIAEGKEFMKWGIIALFILLSWRALISFFSGQVGFNKNITEVQLPTDGDTVSNTSILIPDQTGAEIKCNPSDNPKIPC